MVATVCTGAAAWAMIEDSRLAARISTIVPSSHAGLMTLCGSWIIGPSRLVSEFILQVHCTSVVAGDSKMKPNPRLLYLGSGSERISLTIGERSGVWIFWPVVRDVGTCQLTLVLVFVADCESACAPVMSRFSAAGAASLTP